MGVGGLTDAPPAAVHLTLTASAPRRAFGIGTLAVLGGILLWVAVNSPQGEPVWLLVLVVAGAAALVGAVALARSTADPIRMTDEGLVTASGRTICHLSEIRSVDRGMLAFKPSGGFLLRLSKPGQMAWAPGMWWRIGRTVGVGGVTNGAQARLMADAITAHQAGMLRSGGR